MKIVARISSIFLLATNFASYAQTNVINYDESADGDLSCASEPFFILGEGTNTFVGTEGGLSGGSNDFDCVNFTIPSGHQLDAVTFRFTSIVDSTDSQSILGRDNWLRTEDFVVLSGATFSTIDPTRYLLNAFDGFDPYSLFVAVLPLSEGNYRYQNGGLFVPGLYTYEIQLSVSALENQGPLPVSTEFVQVSFSGFFDNDPSGVLGGDLSYSGTIVYDPSVAPVSVTTSDGCCPDSTRPTTSKLYDIISFELTIGGTTVSGESPQVSITDSTSPTSDGVSFTASIPVLTLGGVTFTDLRPRLGSFGLNTAFSDIGLDGVADVYLTTLFNQDFNLFFTGLQDADEAGNNGTTVTFLEFAPVSYQFTGSIISAQGIYSGIPFGAEVSATYTFDGNAVGNVLFGNNREDFDNSAVVNREQAGIWRATLQVDGVNLATVDGQRLGIVADTGGVFSEGLFLTSQRGLSDGTVDISVPPMQIGFFGDLYDGLGVLTGDIQTDVIQVLDTLDLGSLTSQVTEWQTLSETGQLLGTLIWNVTSIERANQGELDTEPPVWSVPADISVSAAGAAGTAVTYTATVSDNVAVTSQSCAPASGSVFPIGTTTVTCDASDAAANTASASFTVTVIDDQRPSWSVPADISVIATSLSGAEVNYTAVASDNVGVVSASCVPASATIFPVGSTVVTCNATDAAGNTAEASFNVVVGVNTASSNTLIEGIAGLGLPSGVEASLQSTLGQIDRLINDSNPDNDSAVCDKLAEFLVKVGEREADGSLTTEQSSSLRVFAEAMQATFGCIP